MYGEAQPYCLLSTAITPTGFLLPVTSLFDRLSSRNSLSFGIYKKLSQFREESLSNKLVTGNKNPVGVIAVLNRQYGWASPYTSDSNRQKKALTDAELPKLNTKSYAAIESKPQNVEKIKDNEAIYSDS